ncbi:hypothetical protein [Nostocoides vanveenii]|uniref:Uncharacterized protein n=1 Tax=Nostocoides vanveenii TaxID=330835 RepID=A0ABP4XGK9_9MICO
MGLMTSLAAVVTFFTVVIGIAGALLAASVLVLGGEAVVRNHTLRGRRQESVPTYYRHLVLGH